MGTAPLSPFPLGQDDLAPRPRTGAALLGRLATLVRRREDALAQGDHEAVALYEDHIVRCELFQQELDDTFAALLARRAATAGRRR